MTEYKVKIGFWLRAYDGFTIDAGNDREAIAKAKARAKDVMELRSYPDHIDLDDRREGVIAYVDRADPGGVDLDVPIGEDIAFDDDRIHS